MNKLIIYIILIFTVSSHLIAQDKLGVYLETAANNNTKLKSTFNEYMASLQITSQVKALPDPVIAFAYFTKPIETRNGPQQFVIAASQMFPWFGTLKAKGLSAEAMAKANYEKFLDEKSNLFFEVRSSYYSLYYLSKSVLITEENLAFLMSFKEMAKIKVETGTSSVADMLRVEMMIGDMENKLSLLTDEIEVKKTAFRNILNEDANFIIEITPNLLENDIEFTKAQALDSALLNNHKIIQFNYQRDALKSKIDVGKKQGMPSFSIGVDYISVGKGEMNLSGNDALIFPKIGITIPLNRKKYKAIVKESVYLDMAKELQKQNQNNIIENSIESGFKNYSDSKRRIDLFKRQKELSMTTLKIYESEYKSGSKTFEELLSMESKYLNYSLQLEKAKSDKQTAISFINFLLGK